MKNPFQEILENEQLPEIIRQRVIDDIDLINLSLQMADLFVLKSPEVISSFFANPEDNESDSISDSDFSLDPNPQ